MKTSRKILINCVLCLLIVASILAKNWTRHGEILPTARQAQAEREFTLLAAPDHPYLRFDNAATATISARLADNISATSAIVMDVATKRILWQKNADVVNYPASTTKIITALVAREIYDLDDVITITAADLKFGQNLSWHTGTQVKVSALLRALLIVSANEAGMILADHAPGGYDAFVTRMNEKAREMGLSSTSFANPQGFDADLQRMSAKDLALAALELERDEVLAEIVSTPSTTIHDENGAAYTLTNTNKLMADKTLPYQVKGIKTGTTALASEALVSLLEKEGHQIIVVVLSAKTRYNDTTRIADYIFGNYIWQPATN